MAYNWLGEYVPTEVQQYINERYPPTIIDEHENHARDIAAIAIAGITEPLVQKFLSGLTRLWYPDVYPDMIAVPPATTYQQNFPFPGFVRLKKLQLFAPGGVYPSQVDVTVDAITHLPFTLTEKNAAIGPFAFQIIGGSSMTFRNPDATNSGNVYIEWELVTFSEKG
jgi:hypothetical protein